MTALLFVLIYVILLEFFRAWYLHVANAPVLQSEDSWPDVTVIVPYRNEKDNLPVIIQDLLNQHYPGPVPEIILVDDHSDDHAIDYADLFPTIRVIKLDEGEEGKKAAMARGILSAGTRWIVTTDADVRIGINWLASLIKQVEYRQAVMVCGSVQITSNGTFMEDFQKAETAILQAAGIGALDAGFPLLNTGASLAFRKDAWEAVNGYTGHTHLSSGDDTFLMFDLHRKFPGRVVAAPSKAAMVSTTPENGILNILRQRSRWAGKVRFYRSIPVLLTGLLVTSSAVSVVFSLLTGNWALFLLLLFLRGVAELRLLKAATLNSTNISLLNRILMVIVYPFYLTILIPVILFVNPRWKGR